MRTIIYARVSTEDQLEKYGLPTQFRACREYAEKHGLTVVGEVADEGISGTVLERPGLRKVREMARAKSVDVVLMLDVDRLSRNLGHLLILKPEIEKTARLDFVTCKFEDSPSGRMFFGIRGVIGEYERELTRERTMRGQTERARSGLMIGRRVPFGYRYDGKTLVADDTAAPVARKIFADYDNGVSMREIADRLRTSGVPTYSKGRAAMKNAEWGHSQIAFILQNETYCGAAWFNATKRVGDERKRCDASERLALPVPSLVSREQFDRVQGRLRSNQNVGRPSRRYLLRGVLFCAKCGRKMAGETCRGNVYYRCTGRDRQANHACRLTAQGASVDATVWRVLSRTLGNADALRELLAQHETAIRQKPAVDVEDMRKRARKLAAKEETILSLMLDPDMSDKRAELKAQYRASGDERRMIEAELATVNAPKVQAGDWLEGMAASIAVLVKTASAEMKQQIVRRLMPRAEFDGKDLKMTFFIVPELNSMPRPIGQFPTDTRGLQVVINERVAA